MSVLSIKEGEKPVEVPLGDVNLEIRIPHRKESRKQELATGWTVTEKAVGSSLKASSLSNWDVGGGMDESARPNTNKVAIHCSGKYLAHVQGGLLKKEMFEDGPEKGIGEAGCRTVVVSDWNHKIGEFRSRAAVMDLAFAHDPNSAVLALVNVFGDLTVLKIVGSSEADKMETLFTFRVACRGSAPTPYHMVRWCPFIPDGEDQLSNCLEEKGTNGADQRYNRILLITAGHMAEIWSVDEVEQLAATFPGKILGAGDIKSGRSQPFHNLQVTTQSPVVDASVCFDGSMFAALHADGSVNFWDTQDALTANPSELPPCKKRILPPEASGNDGMDNTGFNFIYFPDDLRPRIASDDDCFWTCMVVGTGWTIRVYQLSTWEVVQNVCLAPKTSDWHVAKDPRGSSLMLASQENNQIVFFDIKDFRLARAVLMPAPRIFQFSDIMMRTQPQCENWRSLEFAGFASTGLKLCKVSEGDSSSTETSRTHSATEIPLAARRAMLSDQQLPGCTFSPGGVKRITPPTVEPVYPISPNVHKPKPTKPTSVQDNSAGSLEKRVASIVEDNKSEAKAKTPPKCEISLKNLRKSPKTKSPSAFTTVGVISTPVRKSTLLASNGIESQEDNIGHLPSANASLKNEACEEKGLTSREGEENSATKKISRSPATFYRTQGSLQITRAELALSPVSEFTKIKPKKEAAEVCRAKSGATRLPIEEAINRSFEKTPPPHSVDPDLLASAEEMLRTAENPVEASRAIQKTTATAGSSGSDDGSVTTHPGLISKHDQGDGSVEAAVEAGALASNAVTEELMRKMQDELLTEITRASKMDRIKMTATLKKELAKSKEEQVSITETATATSSGDLAMDFSRVSQVLRELQDHVRRGQYDQAWMSIIGKKLDDLVTLDLRDLVASSKQTKQER